MNQINDTVITVHELSKSYHIYEDPHHRLKQLFARKSKQYYREFWALKNISFELKRGEIFGIIGRNGSGKSTLLQLICGTLEPTSGNVQIRGKIAALLELGAGFDPEFTGRENIYLNGAILGFTQSQIETRYDEIVEFADIGDFIEQPVKRYSSGMFIRLAFAVQACVEPDILIVDEALAVGDVFFRQKCYKRIESLREKGTSIIIVTHNMSDIEQFCQRAILLNHGEVLFLGNATEAVRHYYLIEQNEKEIISPVLMENNEEHQIIFEEKKSSNEWPSSEIFLDISHVAQIGNGWARCLEITMCNDQMQPTSFFKQGETAHFFYAFELFQNIEIPIGALMLQNEKGILVHGKSSLQHDSEVPMFIPKGKIIRFHHQIQLNLACGEYTFEVGFGSISPVDYHRRNQYTHEELNSTIIRICSLSNVYCFQIDKVLSSQRTKLLHYGIADLPGQLMMMIKN